ncbi:MAG: hypothetical protein Q9225_005087 [Loekoesia sp. 1 TL-2023]
MSTPNKDKTNDSRMLDPRLSGRRNAINQEIAFAGSSYKTQGPRVDDLKEEREKGKEREQHEKPSRTPITAGSRKSSQVADRYHLEEKGDQLDVKDGENGGPVGRKTRDERKKQKRPREWVKKSFTAEWRSE